MKKVKFLIIPALMLVMVSLCGCNEKAPTLDIHSACGVENPLADLPWLNEYCNSLDMQYYSSINIDLYKAVDSDEHIFQIYLTYPLDLWYADIGYIKEWRDCTGKIIFNVVYPGTPMSPECQEKLNEFLESIEYVVELYHFVKH